MPDRTDKPGDSLVVKCAREVPERSLSRSRTPLKPHIAAGFSVDAGADRLQTILDASLSRPPAPTQPENIGGEGEASDPAELAALHRPGGAAGEGEDAVEALQRLAQDVEILASLKEWAEILLALEVEGWQLVHVAKLKGGEADAQ